LALLTTLPESADRDRRELDLLIALRAPLIAVTGFAANPAYEARSERAIIIAEKLGDVERLFASPQAQSGYCNATGRLRKARENADQMRTLATRQADRVMLLRAHHSMGQSLLFTGEFASAQRDFESQHLKKPLDRDECRDPRLQVIPSDPTHQEILMAPFAGFYLGSWP
jgi:hypothetical protein